MIVDFSDSKAALSVRVRRAVPLPLHLLTSVPKFLLSCLYPFLLLYRFTASFSASHSIFGHQPETAETPVALSQFMVFCYILCPSS
jgi:hypothetical protein